MRALSPVVWIDAGEIIGLAFQGMACIASLMRDAAVIAALVFWATDTIRRRKSK